MMNSTYECRHLISANDSYRKLNALVDRVKTADMTSDPFYGIKTLIMAAQKIREEEMEGLISGSSKTTETVNDSIISGTTLVQQDSADVSTSETKEAYFSKAEDSFQSLSDYIEDMGRRIPAQGPFICPIEHCAKEFKRKDNLKCHLRTHDPTRTRPFACADCRKSYLRQVDLQRHIETVHLGARQHICDVCDKAFTRKEGLNQHLKRHLSHY